MNRVNNNWNKLPPYSLSSRNEVGLARGITPYSESSPPEEINDDVLPGCPMSTSAINQSLNQSGVQKNIQGRSVSQQAQKMSQRPMVPTSQLSNRHINMASSSSSISMPHYQTGGRIGTNANIADIQLSFTSRTNLDEQRTDVLRILHMLKTYSLSECHDKVHWLATVALHHQRDLELFRAGSTAVEQCLDGQLRRMHRRLLVSGNGKKREKQLDQERKDLTSKNAELKKREAELEQTMTQYEAKCQDMKLEESKLKAEKQQIVKDLEAEKRSAVTKIEQLERERDDYRRRLKEMANQETEMQRLVLKLEHNLEEAVAKNKCVPDRPAEGTNTVEDEIKMLKQRLKRSKTEAKQQCVELNERNHKVAELEAQLKASTEKASKHRHKEMKLRERSTKKTVLLEKALSDKQKAEDELNMLKNDNANLLKKSNFDQFDTRIRKIAQKKLQLDRAIVSIKVQPKCTKCLDIVNCDPKPCLLRAKITQLQLELDEMKKKKAPKVTIRMVDPTIAQPMQQQRSDEVAEKHRQHQQQQVAEEDWSKKRRTSEDATEAFDEPLDCNKRSRLEPTAQIGDSCGPADCSTPASNASSGPSSNTDSEGEGGTVSENATPGPSSTAEKHAQTLTEPACQHQLQTAQPIIFSGQICLQPVVQIAAAPVNEFQPSSHNTSPTPSAQNCQSNAAVPSVMSTSSIEPRTTQLSASQIVTSFMRYISHRPGQNALSLVYEYLQQSVIPVQFHQLIAEQLNIIARTSENARQRF